ncbi:MAG: HEPN domain-containing protein [Clostridiales Family XIII bacterium]|jgi:HEPN domain-containing protein|nr:HEPN domain-containing protein [Clostridiales Family XIII bacterium]
MSENNRIQYWLQIADYDFETAKAMLETRRYLYVGFMCHQTIEKALKAAIARDCADGEMPPKIHNLIKLSVLAKLDGSMSVEQQDLLAMLNPLNIEARYPEYVDGISRTLDMGVCQDLFAKTEDLLCWIKQQL